MHPGCIEKWERHFPFASAEFSLCVPQSYIPLRHINSVSSKTRVVCLGQYKSQFRLEHLLFNSKIVSLNVGLQ